MNTCPGSYSLWVAIAFLLSLPGGIAAQPPIKKATEASAEVPAGSVVKISVTNDLVREHFCGPGFQGDMYLQVATPEFYDQVLVKRWREANPRFARLGFHRDESDPKRLDHLVQTMTMMKDATGTEVYLTGGLRATPEGGARQKWASNLADEIDYVVKNGATNARWHCITNELSLHGWADLRKDLPTFRAYEQALYDELTKRHSPVKILATDASPINNWSTIEWASRNMDDITGIYGGHDYFNQHAPDDPKFYNWFKDKCARIVGVAKGKGKDFILGEFGTRQYFQTRWGTFWGAPEYYQTAKWQPLAGLQMAEATIAGINAGVYAMSSWTFVDWPDTRTGSVNHWGLFPWATGAAIPRAPYYCYPLMTKFFRGPAAVHQVEVTDAMVRVAAIRNEETKTWSIAVVNREPYAVPISIELPANPGKAFRKYVYDPAHVPVTEDGDLQDPAGKVALHDSRLSDTMAPGSLAVYTTAYTDEAPAPVKNLRVMPAGQAVRGILGPTLRWDPSPEKDVIYYRILHTSSSSHGKLGDHLLRPPTHNSHNERIGSSTKPEFVDGGPTRFIPGEYTVIAVNQSGNASQPARVAAPGPPQREP